MKTGIKNGSVKSIGGKPCIYYDGYWIRRYEVEEDTLVNKKRLIDQLTRRVFHHVEPGINTPGFRLDEIRAIYEAEKDPARKRIKGAMLAGALLNRGRDILTSIVELISVGETVEPTNELLEKCGRYFIEALELGKNIKLAHGEEGLDELWGEPFKMFSQSMEGFYESRYIKVSQTMSQIDRITGELVDIIRRFPGFRGARSLILELGESAKLACETLRSDPVIFEVWPRHVAAKEALEGFAPASTGVGDQREVETKRAVLDLIRAGGALIASLSTVRVPMPHSVSRFLERCEQFKHSNRVPSRRPRVGGTSGRTASVHSRNQRLHGRTGL